jgi:hypothetical protein
MLTMEFLSLAGTVGIYLLWLLVPLIPAVLIYKLFPKTEVVAKGPFAGLTLNMSGAFAAYFILCLLSYSWVDHAYVALSDLKHLAWTVRGTFKMVDKDGKVIHPGDEFFSKICVRTQPVTTDFRDTEESGTFEFTVPEMERKLPKLFVETTYNKRILVKVDDVNHTEKTATIKMLTIPGLSLNNSGEARAQTTPQ